MYMDMDRKDLAIDLRMRLGDWFRVMQLAKGGAVPDAMLERVWSAIGDHYYQRQEWPKASVSYERARGSLEKLISCYYILDDFRGLERVAAGLSENHHLLKDVAAKFVSVGLVEQAVAALVRCSDVGGAIDVCVAHSHWARAVELAQRHNFRDLEGLLTQYATHLLAEGRRMEAVELYRKAGMFGRSARLLFEEAVRLKNTAAGARNPVGLKKAFVLAALEADQGARDGKVGVFGLFFV